MSKLTADKARERIAHLSAWRDQRGLTLREEEYLEAMELALLLLDQPEGWTLVPVKPTPHMRLQMHTVGDISCRACGANVSYDCTENVEYSWEDMLNAAPKATV